MIARFFLVPAIPDLFLTYGDHTPTQDEITDKIYDGWRVSLYAYGDIDSAEFELDDEEFAWTRAELLSKELYIELWDWYRDTDPNTDPWLRRARRLFGGQITEIKTRRKGLGRVFKCRALGWAYKLSNLIINQGYAAIPGGDISDRDIIVGRPEVGNREGVTSLFDPVLSIQSYEGLSFPVDFGRSSIKTGIENIGQRQYSFQNLRSVMDRLASEAGFIWRVTADRRLIYRERSDKDGVGVMDLSDEPWAVRKTLGEFSFGEVGNSISGGIEWRGATKITGSFPKELSWGDSKMEAVAVDRTSDGREWTLTSRYMSGGYNSTNGQFRTDVEDYQGIIVAWAWGGEVRALYDMETVIESVSHDPNGREQITLMLPDPVIPTSYPWTLSFSRAAATFELPDEGHRIDASKVKNHVRVFGGYDFDESTQVLLVLPNQLGGRVFPIPEYGRIPTEPDGIRVESVTRSALLKVVSAASVPDDPTTYDVIWDRHNARLFFNTTGSVVSTLDHNISQEFRVTGWYGIPVTGDKINDASVKAYGGVRSVIIVAPELQSTGAAERRARQELLEWDDGIEVLQGLTTDYEDFEVSTLVSVRSVVRDLPGTDPNFVIEAIEITGLSPRKRTYKMKLRRDNFVVDTGRGF